MSLHMSSWHEHPVPSFGVYAGAVDKQPLSVPRPDALQESN